MIGGPERQGLSHSPSNNLTPDSKREGRVRSMPRDSDAAQNQGEDFRWKQAMVLYRLA